MTAPPACTKVIAKRLLRAPPQSYSLGVNSEQEEIVRALIAFSAGAAFLFQPDTYRKGHATREPADLAWVGNGCVVLVYMQRTVGSCADAIEHNLTQAKGWLRAWRGGRRLNGTNGYQSFDLAHDSYPNIAVVSVVDCNDGSLRYHADWAAELRVSRCATITQTALHMLASAGATMFDLLCIVEGLRREGDVDPLGVIPVISQYEERARAMASRSLRYPATLCSEPIALASRYLLAMRQPNMSGPPPGTDLTLAEVFNDLSLFEHLEVVFWFASMIYEFDRIPSGGKAFMMVARLPFRRMDVVLRAGHIDALIANAGYLPPAVADADAGGFDFSLSAARVVEGLNGYLYCPLIAFKGRVGKSRTEALLV